LKLRYPQWKLFGVDLSEELILLNMKNQDLKGIDFHSGSILDSGFLESIHSGFDLIIVNAVLQTLPFEEYKLALRNISRLLNPGGFVIFFEGFYESELVDSITCNFVYSQHSNEYLKEMQYTYVSYEAASTEIKKEGFSSVFFIPFNVSVNLHREKANPRKTFTLKLENGSNLSMLEIISQPWCFLVAQKLNTINLPSTSIVRDKTLLQDLLGTNYLI
jgi:SAM-dependent methyltransferase